MIHPSDGVSTTKIGRHDIAEILLKVALSTKNQSINQSIVKADIHARVLKIKTCR
jgi:hypothetical protein